MSEREDRPVTYGLAAPEDARRLAALFFADMTDLGREPDQAKLCGVAEAALADERAHLQVARDPDGRAIGVVLAVEIWSVKFPGRSLWIEELYVTPDYRRRGIGRELVERLVVWAHERGFAGVELEAYRMNTAASVLYRSLGFRRIARERYSYDMANFDWVLDDA